MHVLLCHTFYQQRGGEDECFDDDAAVLPAAGHRVTTYTRHNDEIAGMGRLAVAGKTLWNREVYAAVRALIRRDRPDVLHCMNTFPLLSPAVLYAAKAEKVPVVLEVPNYRLSCANATHLRDGTVCEDCLGKRVPWAALKHRCYRGSRAGTAVVAALQVAHRAANTWDRAVTLYLTPSEFTRRKLAAGGLPIERIVVKPNCVRPDPGPGPGGGGYAVFAGRLSPEKGIDTLLAAWPRVAGRLPLKLFGDGPLADRVKAAVGPGVEWLGRRPLAEVLAAVGGADLLVMPSVWHEPFGRTVIEAFARGTPVAAARSGALPDLVTPGRTGALFRPSDPADLAATVLDLVADRGRLAGMRTECRREFEAHYTADRNGRLLTAAYERAVAAGPPPAGRISLPTLTHREHNRHSEGEV